MKPALVALLLSFSSLACASGTDLPEADADAPPQEEVGKTDSELKWDPVDREWHNCLVGLQICRCSGNIIDCREPIVIWGTKF